MAIKMTTLENGSIQISDNTSAILRRLQDNLKETADAIAVAAVEGVQTQMLWGYHDVHGLPDNPHTEIVDTGRLFDSITASVQRQSDNTYTVSVGTDVPYAIYVHEGTRKLKARPFITDAMSDSYKDIESAIARTLRNAMRGR